jgi:hypothetical protein
MNIFVLDTDFEKCANYMVDSHVVKMPTEHTQILSTVCRVNGLDVGMKSTHQHHPCTLWAGKSKQNYIWLRDLTLVIGEEWCTRFNHICADEHKSIAVLKTLPIPNLPNIGLTEHALAMPEEYRECDPVKAYRKYYIGAKQHLAKWKHGITPSWYTTK